MCDLLVAVVCFPSVCLDSAHWTSFVKISKCDLHCFVLAGLMY
jgi:hypothetical protein